LSHKHLLEEKSEPALSERDGLGLLLGVGLVVAQRSHAQAHRHERLVDVSTLLQALPSVLRLGSPLRSGEVEDRKARGPNGGGILDHITVDDWELDDLDGEDSVGATGATVEQGGEHLAVLLTLAEHQVCLLHVLDTHLGQALNEMVHIVGVEKKLGLVRLSTEKKEEKKAR